MSSSNDYYAAILSSIITNLYRYVVPVFYILANLGNLLSAMVFSQKPWRKNVCVFYLSVCLLCDTCFLNSYLLGSIFTYGYNINVHYSSVILCKLFYYAAFLFPTLLLTVLTLASVDRLLISSQNVDTRLYSSKRLAYFSISVATFCLMVFFVHILVKTNLYELYPSVVVCTLGISQTYLDFVSYSSLVIDSFFSCSLIILLLLSLKNVRRIRAVPRHQRHQIRTMTKKDFQLLRCLFFLDSLYIPFTMFVSINLAYTAAIQHRNPTPFQKIIGNFVTQLLSCLYYIPFGVSFVIFMCVSKAFRNEVKRMIYKMIGRNSMVAPEEENRQENVRTDKIELNVVNVDVSPPSLSNK